VFISNGDDSVAVKPSTPCTRNILVEDSEFHHGHGCSIGSVGHGCVENVVFRNIKMVSQQCGCRVKSYSSTEGDGSVRNISWVNITMEDVASCVSVNDM
jgi:polygalacturonase